ncbi:MAG TPA: sensor domain-containing protein [Gaiella sp.]|nr:sensor domain-containing protein [Gaiella sp.]
MTAFLTRPFRLQTARELAFLLLGGLTAIVGFTVQVAGLSAGLSLLITFVGLPILLALAVVDRWLCGIERLRAGLVLGEPVRGSYRPPAAKGFVAWAKAIATDPQTWKDLGWVWLNAVLGFASAIVAVTLVASVLWALTLPIYWWFLPEEALPQLWPDSRIDTWREVLGVVAAGLVLLPVVALALTGLARGQAWLARAILGPSERSELEQRVGVLTRTRAAAADAQTNELRRIERDLHDGAQARMVAVTMDLGLAQEKLADDPEAARALVASAQAEARTAIADLRRLVGGIAPAVLTDRGLDAALSALVASCRIPVSLDVRPGPRLPDAVEVAAYFVVSEALVNAQKHAEAASATVHLRRQGDRLVVDVADDGRGGAAIGAGSGLSGLRDRSRHSTGRLSSPAHPAARRSSVRSSRASRDRRGPRAPPRGARAPARGERPRGRHLRGQRHRPPARDRRREAGRGRRRRPPPPDVPRRGPAGGDRGAPAPTRLPRARPLAVRRARLRVRAARGRRRRRRVPAEGARRRRRRLRRRGAARRRGGTALDPEVVRQLVARRGPLDMLTPREREVLELMAEGRSNAGIAEALVVTESAVEKHVRQIFAKLRLAPAEGDHRRVLAVVAYLRSTA